MQCWMARAWRTHLTEDAGRAARQSNEAPEHDGGSGGGSARACGAALARCILVKLPVLYCTATLEQAQLVAAQLPARAPRRCRRGSGDGRRQWRCSTESSPALTRVHLLLHQVSRRHDRALVDGASHPASALRAKCGGLWKTAGRAPAAGGGCVGGLADCNCSAAALSCACRPAERGMCCVLSRVHGWPF